MNLKLLLFTLLSFLTISPVQADREDGRTSEDIAAFLYGGAVSGPGKIGLRDQLGLSASSLAPASTSWFGLKQASSRVCIPVYSTPLSNGVDTSVTYRIALPFAQYTYGIRFVFPNFYTQGAGGESAVGGSTINVTAALEYNGEFKSITFGGALSTAISVTRIAISDPCTIDIPAGATAYLRVCPTVTGGGKWPLVAQAGPNDSWSASNTDLTLTTGALPNVGPSGVYAPFAVLGNTYPNSTGSCLFIGDSIGAGVGDISLFKEGGFLVRAFGDSSPWANYCIPGLTLAQQVGPESATTNRSALYGSFDYCISEIGSNSLGTDTLATMQAAYLKLWSKFQARGIPVYQTTILPRVTSTDNFQTAANQTLATLGGSTITGATNASPIVVTTSAVNGLTTGQSLKIAGVGGNTATNGTWIVTVLSTSTFSLNGSTGNGTFTSGGTAYVCESTRIPLNAWIRSKPAPLTGVIDTCAPVEVNASNQLTQDGGRWLAASSSVTGTVNTLGTSTNLIDSTKSWTASQWKGYSVVITGGTGVGQVRQIQNNTSTALTVSPAWSPTLDLTSTYSVYAAPTLDGVHPSAYEAQVISGTVPLSSFPRK